MKFLKWNDFNKLYIFQSNFDKNRIKMDKEAGQLSFIVHNIEQKYSFIKDINNEEIRKVEYRIKFQQVGKNRV